jgi:hypothetical protein
VAQVAAELGTPLLPWQRFVADVALELDPQTERLAYREVVLTVPRQSGKTTLLLAVMVDRAIGFGHRQNVVYAAQTRNDARHKWEDDQLPVLDASPFRPLYRTRKANGSEAILWRNGSRHGLIASTKKSGHGSTTDLAVIDEAFAQPDWRLEQSLKPAMITRPEPQLWVVSTAGDQDSAYLWTKVERGREACQLGTDTGVAYFEWSADEDADAGNPATWWSCMPALGHTVTEAAVAADFLSMPGSEFERAYLNRWVRERATDDRVIPREWWEACAVVRSMPLDPVTFAIDVTPDHAWSSIAVASDAADGRVHLELIEHRPGTEWVVDRLAALCTRWNPSAVAADVTGPVGSLIPRIERNGVTITPIGAREQTQAAGMFYELVESRRIAHLEQPEMAAALEGARRRAVGDAWKWSRVNSSVDISPLVAVTFALWAHHRAEAPVDIAAGIW